jgi:hypothetical protein
MRLAEKLDWKGLTVSRPLVTIYTPRDVVFVTSAFWPTMFCLILTKKTDCLSKELLVVSLCNAHRRCFCQL